MSGLEAYAGTVLTYALERSVAFAVVFLVAGGLWLATRRWMSSHVGSLWFLLPLWVLVLPLEGWIPNPWRTANPIESLARAVLATEVAPAPVNSGSAGPEEGSGGELLSKIHASAAAGGPERVAAPSAADGSTGYARSLIVVLWGLGVAVFLVRLKRGQSRIPALLKSARPVDSVALSIDLSVLCREAGVRPPPALLESPEFDSPVVWLGVRRGSSTPPALEPGRAAIILPEGLALRLQTSELRWVLLHELAHLRRRDHWAELVQRVLGAVFFFHPLVWVTNKVARIYREMACDDAALARCTPGDRSRCAHALLEVVAHSARLASRSHSAVLNPRTIPTLSALTHSKKLTQRRIMRLVETNRPHTRGLRISGLLTMLFASGAALAAARFPATTPQDGATGSVERTPIAAQLATDWLMAAQEKDGGWVYAPPSTAPGDGATGADDPQAGPAGGAAQAAFDPYYSDVALTALAVQALARRAQDEPNNVALREAIDRGVANLLSMQDPDSGAFGPREGTFMVAQALATVAVAKASIGHMTPEREDSLQNSLTFLVKAKNPYSGWRYDYPPSGDADTRMTGYALLALCAASEAGVGCDPGVFAGGLDYLVRNENATTGRTNYMDDVKFAYRSAGRFESFPAEFAETPTAMHLLLRSQAGIAEEFSSEVRAAIALLGSKTPEWNTEKGTIDYSYWWHGTRALASSSERGEVWRIWSKNLRHALQENQILSGPLKGTWPTVDAWSAPGMEVYTAAAGALTLYAVLDSE